MPLSSFPTSIAAALILALPIAFAMGQDDAPPSSAPTPRAPRTGYLAIKTETLPRDSNGFLKPEVWDIVKAEAAAHPISNEASILKSRPIIQAYYATQANWKAPEPASPPAGRLRNLSDTPKQPRFPLTEKVWPSHPGDASICLWEDDKLAAMSLGVDDNNARDLPYWRQLSKKYGGLNITWNLITFNIDGVVEKGRGASAGSWKEWQQMLNEGFHIASHSMTHNHDPVPADGWPGPDWEAAESQRLIDSHLPGHKTRMFAYPGSGVHVFGITRDSSNNSAWRPSLVKYYAAARGGGGQPISEANMIDYFNIHSTTAVQNILGNTDPKMAQYDLNNLFASDPKNPYHKYYRGWANAFIHFINDGIDFDTNPGTIAYAKVLAFYNDHRADLWTGFIDDVALYGEERDTATLTTNVTGDAGIFFTLTDKMDPAVFDYPLTVKVRLPNAWKGAAAQQNGAPTPVQVVVHDGAPYALVKAVPDRGVVTLTPATSK